MSGKNNLRFDGLIFDLDGTLWQTRDAAVYAFTKTCEAYPDLVTSAGAEMLAPTMGLNMMQLAEVFLRGETPERKLEIMTKSVEYTIEYMAAHNGVYPGVANTIAGLYGQTRIFIVSDGPEAFIRAFLALSGTTEQIEAYAFLTDKCGKVENLRRIVDTYGLKRPLYVGDTAADAAAAQALGVPFAFASYGYGKAERYDYFLREFADVGGLL